MAVISQGLTIPQGLQDGSIASATQITPLYNALNAFTIPGSVLVWGQGFVNDATTTTLTIGGTVTKDYTVSIPLAKSALVYIPFQTNGSGAATAMTFQFRVNAANVTGAVAISAGAKVNAVGGMIIIHIGARDAVFNDSMITKEMDTGGTAPSYFPLTAPLPNSDITTVGITIGGAQAAATCVLNHERFWVEQ